MPMVVFGSGMFGKDAQFKGHRHSVVGRIYAHLKHRASLGELCLVNIDEFYTSQVCNICKQKNLEHVKSSSGKQLHAILQCKTCNGLIWNRDVMASKNIWDIAWSMWRGESRPEAFKPPLQQKQQQQQQPGPSQAPQQQQQQQ